MPIKGMTDQAPLVPESKRCSRCKQVLPVANFFRNKHRSSGLSDYCKVCQRQAVKASQAKKPEWYKEQARNHARERYASDPVAAAAAARAWRASNPEKRRAIRRRTYLRYQEQNRAYARSYYAAHPEQFTSYRANIDRDKIRAFGRASYRRHREAIIERGRRRSLLHRQGRGTHTLAQWDLLVSFYAPERLCLACGQFKPLTRDHVIPLHKGGSDNPSNIQCLCRECNTRKFIASTDYRWDCGAFAASLEQKG